MAPNTGSVQNAGDDLALVCRWPCDASQTIAKQAITSF
jgi:hypothetical protein